MVIPSYRSKFHPAVSWVASLPPEEESSAPPPLLLVTSCAGKCRQIPSKDGDKDLCDGLVDDPKEVGLARRCATASE